MTAQNQKENIYKQFIQVIQLQVSKLGFYHNLSLKPKEILGTQSNVSNPVGTDMKKDIFSNVYVKVGQVDTIPEPKATATFDEVPGPVSLKRLARFWTFVPIVGTQVTASTIQYLLSAGKLFGKLHLHIKNCSSI